MTAYDIYKAAKFDIEEKYGDTLNSTDKLLQVSKDVRAIGEAVMDIHMTEETAIAVAMAFIDYAKACEGELEDAGFLAGEWEANHYNLVEAPLKEIPAREGYIVSESGREIPFVTARMQMDDTLYLKACDGHYASDLQGIYEAYCDLYREKTGTSPDLEWDFLTVEEAEALDPDDREYRGISFYEDEEEGGLAVLLGKDGHYGIIDRDGAFETTERIDFRQLYYSDQEGPVYKGYPIRAFLKGPWNPAWDEK